MRERKIVKESAITLSTFSYNNFHILKSNQTSNSCALYDDKNFSY